MWDWKKEGDFGELYGDSAKGISAAEQRSADANLGIRTSRLAFGSLTISRLGWGPTGETHSFASLLRNRFAFIVAIVKLKRTRYETNRPY